MTSFFVISLSSFCLCSSYLPFFLNPVLTFLNLFSLAYNRYAHYDNLKSFSDFTTFGGWKTPTAKQYEGDVTLCSFGVDMDYGYI